MYINKAELISLLYKFKKQKAMKDIILLLDIENYQPSYKLVITMLALKFKVDIIVIFELY